MNVFNLNYFRYPVLLSIFLLTSCVSSWQSKGQVQLLEDGLYVASYKWYQMENEYGKDRSISVPAYLESIDLIPLECINGIITIRGGNAEGGWGWTEFRCK